MSKSSKKHHCGPNTEPQPTPKWVSIVENTLWVVVLLIATFGILFIGIVIGSGNERKKIASATPFPTAHPEWNRYRQVTNYTNRMPKGVRLLQSNSGTYMIEGVPGSAYLPMAGFKTQHEAIAEAWQSVLRAADSVKIRYITDHAMPLEFSEVVTRDYVDKKADRQFVTNVIEELAEPKKRDANPAYRYDWIRLGTNQFPNDIMAFTNTPIEYIIIDNHARHKTNRIIFDEDYDSESDK
jgi:hypothetical protein